MRKYLIIAATVLVGIAFTSCKSKDESRYRMAYEKAKSQEMPQTSTAPVQYAQPAQPSNEAPVVTPIEQSAAQPASADASRVPVRSEKMNIINGSGLKAYSVIVGAFTMRGNAEGLQNQLKNAGYDAQLAFNPDRNMYRVVIATFDTREEAAKSRQSILSSHPDAWLLVKQ